VKVEKMVTGIQKGLETYQYLFVGVMGCNSIPPSMISSQDPEEDMRSQWDWCEYVEFEMGPKVVLGFEIKVPEDIRQVVIVGGIKNSASQKCLLIQFQISWPPMLP